MAVRRLLISNLILLSEQEQASDARVHRVPRRRRIALDRLEVRPLPAVGRVGLGYRVHDPQLLIGSRHLERDARE